MRTGDPCLASTPVRIRCAKICRIGMGSWMASIRGSMAISEQKRRHCFQTVLAEVALPVLTPVLTAF